MLRDIESFAQEIGRERSMRELCDYGIGAQNLSNLGVQDVIRLTNSHQHVMAIEGDGLNIVGDCPISWPPG